MFPEKVLVCTVLVVIATVSAERHYVVNKGCNTCTKRGPPSCRQWCIITVNVGCCLQRRYVCCSYREKLGVCPVAQPSCPKPYPYHATRVFECHHDFHCPLGYKCCSDCCFTHKICKQMHSATPTSAPWPKPSVFTKPTTSTTNSTTTTTTTTTITPPTTTLSTTTQFIIEVPEVEDETVTVTQDRQPTTLPNPTVEEGSGYGINDLEEPHAALVQGFLDDEDFLH
ncbi:hypothetical protein PPYR_12745 [Photinus pyralis]|uniref:WAP domain-containing protein n=1 Tax=Photinus pyralis TaxID=7054 RepID=A0A5N4A741_PHOPY|nr:uncharacterized protein LOC116179610 [Photinus pyralis]KAB0793125.1 hypothetical protein PPYR_12745 [Photinus pyralis]